MHVPLVYSILFLSRFLSLLSCIPLVYYTPSFSCSYTRIFFLAYLSFFVPHILPFCFFRILDVLLLVHNFYDCKFFSCMCRSYICSILFLSCVLFLLSCIPFVYYNSSLFALVYSYIFPVVHSVFAVVCLHSRPYCWLSFVLYLFLVHSILPLVSSSRTLVLSSCALTLVYYPFDISIAISARICCILAFVCCILDLVCCILAPVCSRIYIFLVYIMSFLHWYARIIPLVRYHSERLLV